MWPWKHRAAPRASSLADANPHHLGLLRTPQERAVAARRLRASVLLQALFTDELVIADAHALDNLAVRSLLSADEAVPDCPADLVELVQSQRLVIARRDTMTSYAELRADQYRRGISDVPDEEYAAHLDLITDGPARTWSLRDVGAAFTAAARGELVREYERATGDDDRTVLEAAVTWVDAHTPLLYNDFRGVFLAGLPDPLHRLWLDQLVGKAYTLAFPSVLGINTVGENQAESPLRFAVLDTTEAAAADAADTGPADQALPCTVLCESVLSRLPAWIVREATQLPARRNLLREQVKKRPDVDRIRDLTFEVVESVDAAATRYFLGHGQGHVLAEYAEIKPKLTVRGWRSIGTTAAFGTFEVLMSVVAHDGSGMVLTKLGKVALDTYQTWEEVRDESVLRQSGERELRRLREARLISPTNRLLQVEASPGRLRTL